MLMGTAFNSAVSVILRLAQKEGIQCIGELGIDVIRDKFNSSYPKSSARINDDRLRFTQRVLSAAMEKIEGHVKAGRRVRVVKIEFRIINLLKARLDIFLLRGKQDITTCSVFQQNHHTRTATNALCFLM
jgi:hypothetical protein